MIRLSRPDPPSPTRRPARTPAPFYFVRPFRLGVSIAVQVVLPRTIQLLFVGGRCRHRQPRLFAVDKGPPTVPGAELSRPVGGDNDLGNVLVAELAHVLVANRSVTVDVTM